MLKKYILGFVMLGFGVLSVEAQTQRNLNQEVKVVKAYQPVISDAKRISELPQIVDTVRFVPTFSYQVHTRPLVEVYEPQPIRAAKMVGEPLMPLYGHRLQVGGGNYSTLFGDYRFNNKRSKKFDFGVHLQHFSSNGKIKLENDEKEKGTYSRQMAEIHGKTFLKEGVLGGKAFFLGNGVRYYGFPNQAEGVLPIAPQRDESLTGKQRYTTYGVEAGYASRFRDEDRMNFVVGVNYQHFNDKFVVKEDDFSISGKMIQRKEQNFWGLEGGIEVLNASGLRYWDEKEKFQDSRKSGFVKLNPYYLLQPGRWNIRLGLATYIAMGDDSDLKLYPDMNFEYQAVEHILTLFAGLGGSYEVNTSSKIAEENPFVYSGLNVENTDHQLHLLGGMKGNFSSDASFRLSAEYSIVKNQYFFAKREVLSLLEQDALLESIYANKFGVVYDDMDVLQVAADFNLKWNEKLNLAAGVKVFQYSMKEQEKAWHKPGFEMKLDAEYHFTDDWRFTAGVNLLDKRYALREDGAKSLKAVYDLNLGSEFQIDDRFTAFARLNNVLAQKYYRWDGYPMQGFNALVGIQFDF